MGVGNPGGNLHGEVGLVLAGEHAICHLVENLHQLLSVVLADGKDDRLADLTAHGIAEGILQKGLAEKQVCGLSEKVLLELPLLKGLLLVFARVVGEGGHEALFREQFGGDFGAGIHDDRVDEVAILHTIK